MRSVQKRRESISRSERKCQEKGKLTLESWMLGERGDIPRSWQKDNSGRGDRK